MRMASHSPGSPKVRFDGGQVRKRWDPSAGGLACVFIGMVVLCG
jgi:hypothetical protein